MYRSFLFFAAAFVALMAGALFYAARMPVERVSAPAPPTANAARVEFPAFSLTDIDGKTRDFGEFSGRPRLLNFWATWCGPCRREIPLLKAFQAEQGENGILVIGIAVDFIDEVRRYAETAGFNYPVLVGQDDAMAVADSSGVPFNAMPFTMVIGRDGRFLGAYLGELHRQELDAIARILTDLDAGAIPVENAKKALEQL